MGTPETMALDNRHWSADRVTNLRRRAAIARHGAEARCQHSAELQRSLDGITGARLQAVYSAEARSVRVARTAGGRGGGAVHAYPDGTGSVYVRAVIVDGQFRVSIIDDGTGPHVPSATPGLGCGLALIAASTDQFTIRRRRKRGTEIDLRWTLHARPAHRLPGPNTDSRSPKP